LTYNVRNCKGLDNNTDYKRVADIISRVDADVVALQELDSATERSNKVVVWKNLQYKPACSQPTGFHQLSGWKIWN